MKLIKKGVCILYDSKKITHNILFVLVAVLMIWQCFLIDVHESDLKPYPQDITYESQYIKQLDAFLKGQLELDLEVDPKLEGLENPYSPEQRDEAGVTFHWDHAYFEGKYYSYFGVAPIFTVYLPCYLITDKLPNEALVCLVLAISAIIFMAFAVREAVLTFCKRVNLWLFLAGMASVIAVSGVYMAVLCSDVYYIPVVSALSCSMAFIFFSLGSVRKKNILFRNIYLVLAAISLTLTVLSRPTVAIMCVAIFPIFLLIVKQEGFKKSIGSVCSFALPIVLGAAAVMWYNAARFGSVFDFGASYQLTVCDVSQNELDKSFAFSALFSYFLHPIWETGTELGIGLSGQLALPPESRYVYGDIYAGAFAFALPTALFFYRRNMEQNARDKDRAKFFTAVKHSVVLGICALSCFVAFFDFCYAGVNMRYIYDIVPMLSLSGAFVLLDMQARCKGYMKAVMAAVCIVFFIVAIRSGMDVVTIFKERM